MNIHEYQARDLLEQFQVPCPRGRAAATPEEAQRAATDLGGGRLVVKAQVHAGGRGKGKFLNGFQGGVHVVEGPAQAGEIAGKMLGQTLVTHQTGAAGRVVRKVMVAEAVRPERELYLAILLDRATGAPVVVASTEGGMDIEAVAAATPEKILREPVPRDLGLQPYQTRKLAKMLGLTPDQSRQATVLLTNLYRLFVGCDCSLLEINPLVVTGDGRVLALDSKINFDDNALFRHPDILALRDTEEEDPREVQASRFGLNYIGLDGSIGCMVNGAGLAMATMDIIKHHGGSPANFLDVGGGASEEQVTEAFKILASDDKVRAILVNIFGGIMRCDIIAQGIINAVRAVDLKVPLVVRLEGTRVEEGRKMLEESGVSLVAATDLGDAARKVVAAVGAS